MKESQLPGDASRRDFLRTAGLGAMALGVGARGDLAAAASPSGKGGAAGLCRRRLDAPTEP